VTSARIVRPANMPVSHGMQTLGEYSTHRAFRALGTALADTISCAAGR